MALRRLAFPGALARPLAALGRRWRSSRSWNRFREEKYGALQLQPGGESDFVVVGVADLRRSLPLRDIVALAEPSYGSEAAARAIPKVLPRGNCIVVSFGPFRSVVLSGQALLFDPTQPVTNFAAQHVCNFVRDSRAEDKALGLEPSPFELLCLDGMLDYVCESYARRTALFLPVVEGILGKLMSQDVENQALHLLVPLRTGLDAFQQKVEEMIQLLEALQANDDDMLQLNLTEKKRLPEGAQLDKGLHDRVELMLEHYHRELLVSKQQILLMMRRLRSTQEHLALNLDLFRNQVIRLDLRVNMAALSCATVAIVSGLMGMNVTVPFQTDDFPDTTAFWALALSGVSAGLFTWVALERSMRRHSNEFFTRKQDQDMLSALHTLLSEMHTVDVALQVASRGDDGTGDPRQCSINLSQFKDHLTRVRGADAPHLSDGELRTFFQLLDTSQDGELQAEEIAQDMKTVTIKDFPEKPVSAFPRPENANPEEDYTPKSEPVK